MRCQSYWRRTADVDLKQQDNLYTVAEINGGTDGACGGRVVKAALHFVRVDGLERVLAAMRTANDCVSDHYREKGIVIRQPRANFAGTSHDCRPAKSASTANGTGIIVEALARRKAAGLPVFTVMSLRQHAGKWACDASGCDGYARSVMRTTGDMDEQNVTFPSTMVDRIVPAVTPRWRNEQPTGVRDPAGAAS